MRSEAILKRIVIGMTLTAVTIIPVFAKIIQYYSFNISNFDTGIYSNVLCNTINGNIFYSSILNKNDLGEHFSPIIATFIPFYFLYATPLWILAFQGAAIGLTYLLIYRIAGFVLNGSGAAHEWFVPLFFVLLAISYKPLSHALMYQFHPSTIGVPILSGCVLALLKGATRTFWCLSLLLLLTKENAPLALFGLAIFAWLTLGYKKLGIALFVVSLLSAVFIFAFAMPAFQEHGWHHLSRFGPLQHWDLKFNYIILLLAPLGFLPILAWRTLLAAVPLVGLNLSVKYVAQFSTNYQYDDLSSVFLLVSAIYGFARLDRLSRDHQAIRNLPHVLIVALVIVSSPLESRPIRYLWKEWPSKADWQLHEELEPYRSLSESVRVISEGSIGPYLSCRYRYMHLENDVRRYARKFEVDDIILIPKKKAKAFRDIREFLKSKNGVAVVHDSEVLEVYSIKDRISITP